MRLSAFIRSDVKSIVEEWESFARKLMPAAEGMSPLALRDHIKNILDFIVTDMESSQTSDEQATKSQGEKRRDLGEDSAAETHASLRHAGGFNMNQMVSEYRALRASVIKLWRKRTPKVGMDDIEDVTRFNEAIDQALTVSITHYAGKIEASRDIFLGILGHDLKNPLGASNMCARLLAQTGGFTERQATYIEHMVESTDRALSIVASLLDLTSTRLGSGLPITRAPMNMGYVGRQLVDEVRAMHPGRTLNLEVTGEMDGEWDCARIGQVFSNLLANAAQYSFQRSTVGVKLEGSAHEVTLSVHNDGVPIPPEALGTLFNSFTRAGAARRANKDTIGNLGLGLYIVREIVEAHGGSIRVTSSEAAGTTFTAGFPRLAA